LRVDERERDELLLQQLPQVRLIATALHRRLPNHVLLEDLIQEGIIGLMDAVEKYDPVRQTQFNMYAEFRIRGAMLDSLRKTDWASRKLRRDKRRLLATEARMRDMQGGPPDVPAVAREFGISLAAFHQLVRDIENSHIQQLSHEEVLHANQEPSALERLLHSEWLDGVRKALDCLTEKQRVVIALYYVEEMRMKDIGAHLNIGEARVSQIHASALTNLRNALAGTSVPKQ